MPNKQAPDQTRLSIAWQEPALMQVGKNGLTDEVIAEAKRLLKKHKYVKIRLLRSTEADRTTKTGMFEELCTKAGAHLAGVRGNTAVVYKR